MCISILFYLNDAILPVCYKSYNYSQLGHAMAVVKLHRHKTFSQPGGNVLAAATESESVQHTW